MTVALLTTCAAQAFRPGLAPAFGRLCAYLHQDLAIPPAQTCCGLPAWEAGQQGAAAAAARRTLQIFAGYKRVVALSPACLQMVQQHLPALLAGQPEAAEAQALANRAISWCDFVAEHPGLPALRLAFAGRVAFFPSCRVQDEPAARRLLAAVQGLELLPDPTRQCCGYGNNLAWRHPDLSQALARPVVTALRLSRADCIVTTSSGCLSHLAPLIQRAGAPPILHLAEFLESAITA